MSNIHVIIGEDDYLVAETARKVIGDGVGLEVIDSLNATNAELQIKDLKEAEASFATPPFLDPKKVTWWRNVHFLPGASKKDASEEVKSALERFAKKLVANPLPDNQHFILSGPKLLKTSIFAKTLQPVVEMSVFSSGKPWEAARSAAKRVKEFAAEMGLRFAPGQEEKFVSVVGTDTRSLLSELRKMRDYIGGEKDTIEAADIAEVTCQGYGVEPMLWNVTDAIGRRDLDTALTEMRKFELESGFSVLMTAVIEKFFRQLIDVRNGRTEGMSPNAVGKSEGFLRNWTTNELRAARARFLMLREKIVSGLTCGDVLVVSTLVRVMRKTSLGHLRNGG